jgi:Tfp pilus assembly protein PilF
MASLAKKSLGGLFLCLALIFCVTQRAFSLDKKASYALSHYIMAVLHEDSGDIDQAIKEYKQALRVEDKVSTIHLSLASSYLKAKDLEKAAQELKSAADLAPEAVEPHAILALLYSAKGKEDLAVAEYESALKNASKLEPKNVDIYKGLGMVYLRQRKFKEAEPIYSLIVGLLPSEPEGHLYLGSIYNELNKNDLAEKEFKQALNLEPGYDQALNALGYLYADTNRNLNEAEGMIRKALEANPENGAYIDSLGWVYFRKGKLPEAIIELEKASVLVEDPVIFAHLGDAYFKARDITKAKLNWEKSLKLDPNQDDIKKKIQQLPAAQ